MKYSKHTLSRSTGPKHVLINNPQQNISHVTSYSSLPENLRKGTPIWHLLPIVLGIWKLNNLTSIYPDFERSQHVRHHKFIYIYILDEQLRSLHQPVKQNIIYWHKTFIARFSTFYTSFTSMLCSPCLSVPYSQQNFIFHFHHPRIDSCKPPHYTYFLDSTSNALLWTRRLLLQTHLQLRGCIFE